ncbi:MAG: hypothetical protein ACSLEW_04650 [Nocardioides sp.]
MRRLVAALVVIALVGGGAAWAWEHVSGVVEELVDEPQDCSVTVGETTATLSREQAHNAALIAAVAVERGLPARAVTIAVATAMQESKLHNIDYGDRDSIGLFQQRPSQGWGSVEQILDEEYSINAFYDALLAHDFTTMEVTDAAQAVQRSAYPTAYAQHEAEARVLASALTGWSPATLTCAETTLKDPDADALVGAADTWFDSPATVRGKVVLVSPPGRRTGWALAHYLVVGADELGIRSVALRGQRWTAAGGWTRDGSGTEVLRVGLA